VSTEHPVGRPDVSRRVGSGSFGDTEILGLEPTRDASDPAVAGWLREVLWERAVVCVRLGAKLTDEELRALVSMLGDIKDPVGHDADGNPLRYGDERQIIDAGFVLTDELRESLGDISLGGDDVRPGLFQFFHTDDSYVDQPASVTVLHARALPQGGGGDTCFIDMRAAYELLDETERSRLIGLRAVHAYNNRDAFPPRPAAVATLAALVDVAHPVVRAYDVTGQPALYFDLDRATHIEGLSDDEGRALLQSLQDHAEQNAPWYAHEWHPHDVLIWDNASVQHRASGDFEVGEPRRFWRYMVTGARPEAFATEQLA
jgi:alpha-ketoglutarate-dependent taurine dioxygenase